MIGDLVWHKPLKNRCICVASQTGTHACAREADTQVSPDIACPLVVDAKEAMIVL